MKQKQLRRSHRQPVSSARLEIVRSAPPAPVLSVHLSVNLSEAEVAFSVGANSVNSAPTQA
jgi:hypothetical protein